MKLKRENWDKVKLGDICSKAQSINFRKQTGLFNYIDIGSIDSDLKRVTEVQDVDWAKASSRARQIIMKGDTLFSTVRVNLERIAFLDSEVNNGIASTGFTVLRSNGKVIPEFLFYSTITPKFIEGLVQLQKGTAYPAVTDKIVFNEEIYLPPIEVQKHLASLFQSIETIIVKVQEEEKILKTLWFRLVNGLIKDKPYFGSLLEGKNLQLVSYCDVTEKVMRKIDPVSFSTERIVAGENLESEDFKIRSWQKVGEGYLGPAFHVLFKPGDILYGSRRTYLKKVALANFEGVCANTTYVIRSKGDILLQDLLKHIMLSERFTQYSIGVSKGSTNPYINWKDLDNFTFQIPDLQSQKEIVKVLDDIVNLIEDFKSLKTMLKTLKQNLLNEILG